MSASRLNGTFTFSLRGTGLGRVDIQKPVHGPLQSTAGQHGVKEFLPLPLTSTHSERLRRIRAVCVAGLVAFSRAPFPSGRGICRTFCRRAAPEASRAAGSIVGEIPVRDRLLGGRAGHPGIRRDETFSPLAWWSQERGRRPAVWNAAMPPPIALWMLPWRVRSRVPERPGSWLRPAAGSGRSAARSRVAPAGQGPGGPRSGEALRVSTG